VKVHTPTIFTNENLYLAYLFFKLDPHLAGNWYKPQKVYRMFHRQEKHTKMYECAKCCSFFLKSIATQLTSVKCMSLSYNKHVKELYFPFICHTSRHFGDMGYNAKCKVIIMAKTSNISIYFSLKYSISIRGCSVANLQKYKKKWKVNVGNIDWILT
jgi:hypothetical protein